MNLPAMGACDLSIGQCLDFATFPGRMRRGKTPRTVEPSRISSCFKRLVGHPALGGGFLRERLLRHGALTGRLSAGTSAPTQKLQKGGGK